MAYINRIRRVSVIMGIYNCAETLSDAIESLLAQTFTDWELIMCDDASTDGGATLDVARQYEAEQDNVLLIQNEKNLGLAATLNHCLEYAQGEYIARMDGDDLSLPDRFAEEVAFLDAHPEYALVSSAMINFDENGDWGIQRNVEIPDKKVFIYRSPFCHAPVLMRRKALNDVGNYTVRNDLRRGQDYYLWHKFFLAGFKGYNFQHALYKMRDDQNAFSRRTFKSRLQGTKVHLEVLKNLGLPKRYYIIAFKGIVKGLAISVLPKVIYDKYHRHQVSKNKL